MSIQKPLSAVDRGKVFGMLAHSSVNQKRKYSGLPYHVHTEAVYEIVKRVTDDEDVLVAALLHDVLEDVTPINDFFDLTYIEHIFNKRVGRIVVGLTDVYIKENYPDMNRAARKKAERERLAQEIPEVKLVKIADLTDNTSDIAKNDPGFAIQYLKEKAALLPLLRVEGDKANESLYLVADEQLQKFVTEFDIHL